MDMIVKMKWMPGRISDLAIYNFIYNTKVGLVIMHTAILVLAVFILLGIGWGVAEIIWKQQLVPIQLFVSRDSIQRRGAWRYAVDRVLLYEDFQKQVQKESKKKIR